MGPPVFIFSPSLFFPTVADMLVCLLGLKWQHCPSLSFDIIMKYQAITTLHFHVFVN
ncbi:hypothetical protein GYH30_044867 [Glycine max]|nr:hypothetical protein GYH30_044867 [Glycine max]